MPDSWTSLHNEHAAGRTTVHRPDSLYDRYVEFEGGILWFPDGAPELQAARAGPAALFGLSLMTGIASAVLFADGHPWASVVLLGVVGCAASLVLLLRRTLRAEAAAEARVERGVVLLPDAVVVRDPPNDQRISRDDIDRVVVRLARRGGDTMQPWVYLVCRGGAEVPLMLSKRSLPTLERWLHR
ncbi:MAG: hypothetical protein ACE37F_20460 [Nannocystaceae bacterium]|nr:hypothetical protein [bacterium]